MQEEVKQWLEQAYADLKTAKDSFTSENFYAAVIFSQQSAEKVLKAVYILEYQSFPPKIHDLVELARRVHAPKYVLNEAAKLTVTYFSSRYPGTMPEIPAKFYTKEKAIAHSKEAEVIIQWAEKKIQL